jgi:hypothetical protein
MAASPPHNTRFMRFISHIACKITDPRHLDPGFSSIYYSLVAQSLAVSGVHTYGQDRASQDYFIELTRTMNTVSNPVETRLKETSTLHPPCLRMVCLTFSGLFERCIGNTIVVAGCI